MKALLKPFPYRYMEYEKRLMEREIKTLFPSAKISDVEGMLMLENLNVRDVKRLRWLTFIGDYNIKNTWYKTYQNIVEGADQFGRGRQHTRYSTHGIHEYKGKFNPQIVHFMVNMLGVNRKSRVLDPFNGSGTTTLECAHLGIKAIGTDVNPMACFIANSKLKAISIDVKAVDITVRNFVKKIIDVRPPLPMCDNERLRYLCKWIPEETLSCLESIRGFARTQDEGLSSIMLTVASDLIREYSYQDPQDLRIRRRISALPTRPFLEAFCDRIAILLRKIDIAQHAVGDLFSYTNHAVCCDIKSDRPLKNIKFDAIITSPPYATALPYIDTQRISLVWLGLCEASQIRNLEASLIGSRETIGGEKKELMGGLSDNAAGLPKRLYSLVQDMEKSVATTDGFRKQAVPLLFYRYLRDMKKMFLNVSKMSKDNARFALIVGHNHTTLGGKTFYINTPDLLAELARDCGWQHEETLILETYKRYGMHQKNAINDESMVVLRKD